INRTGKALDEAYKGKVTLALNQDFDPWVKGLKFRAQGAYDIHSFFEERRKIQPGLFKALGRAPDGSLIMQQTVLDEKAKYSKEIKQYRKYHFGHVKQTACIMFPNNMMKNVGQLLLQLRNE